MLKRNAKRTPDIIEAGNSIRAYCAFQDRSSKQVKKKLVQYGISNEASDQLIKELIQEGFLSDERFARLFVQGKFRIKKWGRHKITRHLREHNIDDKLIKSALEIIDPEEYNDVINLLVKKKSLTEKPLDKFSKKGKIARHLICKGFEDELVWKILNER